MGVSYVRRRRHGALSPVVGENVGRFAQNVFQRCFYNFSPIVKAVNPAIASGRGSPQMTRDHVECSAVVFLT